MQTQAQYYALIQDRTVIHGVGETYDECVEDSELDEAGAARCEFATISPALYAEVIANGGAGLKFSGNDDPGFSPEYVTDAENAAYAAGAAGLTAFRQLADATAALVVTVGPDDLNDIGRAFLHQFSEAAVEVLSL